MADSLESVFAEVEAHLRSPLTLVRVVLSGRRRNMQTPAERIDIRPVLIKEELYLQVADTDGRQMTTKNYLPLDFDAQSFLQAGFANVLVEHTEGTLTLRISKKGDPLIHRTKQSQEQVLSHDRAKDRLLDSADPFLIEVGISDTSGKVKAAKQDKYRQVEEFLRLLVPTFKSAIEAGHIDQPTPEKPLRIVDLGCGHAYLTFATHQYLASHGIPVKVIGIDIREVSRERNTAIAMRLGIEETIEFRAQEISAAEVEKVDIAIALHACDTATDDAIAWAVNREVKLILVAPCCHHDIQSQMKEIPEPWTIMTRQGIMKERLGDLITDSLRIQILKLRGYRVEAIEFIGGEHTPRNLMIRAVKTGARPDSIEQARYDEMISLWKVKPALASLIKS